MFEYAIDGRSVLLTIREHSVLHALSKITAENTVNSEVAKYCKFQMTSPEIGKEITSLREKGFMHYHHISNGRFKYDLIAQYKNIATPEMITAHKEGRSITTAVTKIQQSDEEIIQTRFNQEQQNILDRVAEIMKSDETQYVLNVTGQGGSGKSYVIHELARLYKNKDFYITASTGVAAKAVNGRTIHSYLGLQPVLNEETTVADEAIEFDNDMPQSNGTSNTLLILEESSMIGKRMFDRVLQTQFKILILFGDPNQLAPVRDKRVDFTVFETIHLIKQMRVRENTQASKLIKDYKESKDMGTTIDVMHYVDGLTVKHIQPKELKDHYHANKWKDKRVVSYTNKMTEAVVRYIEPTTNEYQLHTNITVYDGKVAETIAVNGEFVEIDRYFNSWKEASNAYIQKYGESPRHFTTWKNDFPFKVSYVSLKGIDTHFVKMITEGFDEYEAEETRRNNTMIYERNKLREAFGEDWKYHKSDSYNNAVKAFMALSTGVIRARHKCSSTAHKVQGSSLQSVYVMVDEVVNNAELMYVALSRAVEEIILVKRT